MQESHLLTLLLWCTVLLPFTAAQPSEEEDDSLDSATMAILVLVVVSAVLFLGSFSLWIQNCCVDSTIPDLRSRNFRSLMSVGSESRFRQRGSHRLDSPAGVDKAVIDSFPTMAYSTAREMKIGVGSLECAICLSEFSGEELLRLLPSCDHVFHPHCIARWLANHATCPVCRARVTDNRTSPIEKEGNISLAATAINPEEESAEDRNSASMSQSSGDHERFTLKLPEGVKEEIVKAGLKLKKKRSASCEDVPGESSGSQIGRWLGWSERWSASVAPSDCMAVNAHGTGDGLDMLPV